MICSPQTDAAVRAALLPNISSGSESQAAEMGSPSTYPMGIGSIIEPSGEPIAVSKLTSESLTRIEELLIRGERKQAYTYALDQKLWAHAMIIASSIDKEAWKEVVNDFLHTELASKDEPPHSAALSASRPGSKPTAHLESLRAAYSLFSGQGAASG